MNEIEQMVAGYFHLSRSLHRKKRPATPGEDRIMQSVLKLKEQEERCALRQARLEWAEDRDDWERRWR